MDMEGPVQRITHTRDRRPQLLVRKVSVIESTKFVGIKDDFLSSDANKQSLIDMIAANLKQNDCHVVQAEGDADVVIVQAAVESSKQETTTLTGDDTDLLILLLYHGYVNCKDLYFQSDNGKPTIYNIRVLKDLLGDQTCTDLLFIHAFTDCDISSSIFGVGKISSVSKRYQGRWGTPYCNHAQILSVHHMFIRLM